MGLKWCFPKLNWIVISRDTNNNENSTIFWWQVRRVTKWIIYVLCNSLYNSFRFMTQEYLSFILYCRTGCLVTLKLRECVFFCSKMRWPKFNKMKKLFPFKIESTGTQNPYIGKVFTIGRFTVTVEDVLAEGKL